MTTSTQRALIFLTFLLSVFVALMVVALLFAVEDLNHDVRRLQNTFNAYSHLLPTEEPTQP